MFHRASWDDAARLATSLLAPAPVASVLLLAVAWRRAQTLPDALPLGLFAIMCAVVVPTLYVEHGVRVQRFSDRCLTRREQRLLPLAVGITASLTGLVILALDNAPRDLLVLVGTMVVVLALSLVVTSVWKISLHTTVLAGAGVIAALHFGGVWLVLMGLLLPLVGWARISLREHTPAQAIGGAVLGATAVSAVYGLLS
jgi:membrane-associated phospholipid phosphatase